MKSIYLNSISITTNSLYNITSPRTDAITNSFSLFCIPWLTVIDIVCKAHSIFPYEWNFVSCLWQSCFTYAKCQLMHKTMAWIKSNSLPTELEFFRYSLIILMLLLCLNADFTFLTWPAFYEILIPKTSA